MSQNIGVKKNAAALLVKGKDSYRFLNGMLTQDIQKNFLPNGGRSFFLSNKGKIICPLNFVCLNEEEICLWTDEKNGDALETNLNKFLIADKVEIIRLGVFESWTLTQSEFDLKKLPTKNPLGQEKIFQAIVTEKMYIAPLGLLSPSHVEVLCLRDSGNFKNLDTPLWKNYFEAAQPQWNVDLFADDFFLEFPLADAVSFDKGCYIGQETVARGTFRGKVNKTYSQFTSDKALSVGDITNRAGEKLGTIRSVVGTSGTGIFKINSVQEAELLLNGEGHRLNIKHLVNEETFRKGR
jgi:folate-binding protein YgfZ